MLIDTAERKIIFLSKQGIFVHSTVKEIPNSENEDLKKRFEYIKDILKGKQKEKKNMTEAK